MSLRRRPGSAVALGVLLATAPAVLPQAAPASAAAVAPRAAASGTYSPGDPLTWPNGQLAAQLVHACVPVSDVGAAGADAAAGLGGVTLLGGTVPADLAAQLAAVGAAAPDGIRPFVSSDEEGGRVQRLAAAIYPLPSAQTMGGWTDAAIEDTAFRYGQRMLALGVQMDLAPDADLLVPGAYIASLQRAFSADPARVTTATAAWSRGMRRAGEVPVVKHWPGHGSAPDSHTTAAPVVPPLPVLEARDMVPFNAAFAAGAPVVLVGHLRSEGLTDPGLPATLSPTALAYLRARTGPTTVIMTDSLGMASASSGVGLTPEQAAVRALQAGVDWALTCVPDPVPTVRAVTAALDSGALPRGQALTSVRRVLRLKDAAGLLRTHLAPERTPSAADLRYVDGLYRDLFGRPADAAGATAWATELANERLTRQGLTLSLTHSDEYLSAVVTGLYRDALGRAPDAAGLSAWVALLRRTLTPAQVGTAFYASDERFAATGGTAGDPGPWVAGLYRSLLGRAPDAPGLAAWTQLARSRGRTVVAAGFYGSPESLQRRVQALYRSLLGRGADTAGLATWPPVLAVQGDVALAAYLAASDEYYARAQAGR